MKIILAIMMMLSVATTVCAKTFALEGVYTITERDPCAAEHIDSVVLFTNESGAPQAVFSSAEYTLVYQVHNLNWDGARSVNGMTSPASFDVASFTASVSEDGMRMEGKVDALACDAPWHFQAELVPTFYESDLAPLNFVPDYSTFVGTFSASTNSLEGRLRVMRFGTGPVIANFGNDLVARLAVFDVSRLDTEDGRLEFFAFDEGRVQLKWSLQYGMSEGKLALQGYGISAYGRSYPVNAIQLD